MNETDIAKLETRIDELITVCEQLKSENTALRKREGSLVEEKEQLIKKADKARTRVEGILTRLRSMEQHA